jgi:hypothetical protein
MSGRFDGVPVALRSLSAPAFAPESVPLPPRGPIHTRIYPCLTCPIASLLHATLDPATLQVLGSFVLPAGSHAGVPGVDSRVLPEATGGAANNTSGRARRRSSVERMLQLDTARVQVRCGCPLGFLSLCVWCVDCVSVLRACVCCVHVCVLALRGVCSLRGVCPPSPQALPL